MNTKFVNRIVLRSLLILCTSVGVLVLISEPPSIAAERPIVAKHLSNAGAKPPIRLVRRSTRMVRQGWYCPPDCPPVQCDSGADATTPVPNGNQQAHLAARTQIKISDDARAVAQSNNQFAFDLYKSLSSQEGNRFFSPASISSALAMTYAGAAGETKRQMAEVLHLDLPDARMHGGFGTLNSILNTKNASYRLNTANRLWAQSGFRFEPRFVSLIHQHYGAGLGEVDFAATEQARRTINDWVMTSTQGKIADLIPPGVLQDKTRLVLTNAIYFKGTWQYQFSKAETKDSPFFLAKDHRVDVPMMQQHTGGLRYGQIDKLQLLEMPYAGGDLALVVLLPGEIDGLPQLEEKLSTGSVQKWIAGLRDDYDVSVYLPKFTFTSQTGLKGALSSLGMPAAFSDQAEFPGISTQQEQKLFDALHQAFVDVNEEGTEAAAATGHIGGDLPGPVPQEAVFRADHPFLFLIQDKRTGATLFLGRVVDPR